MEISGFNARQLEPDEDGTQYYSAQGAQTIYLIYMNENGAPELMACFEGTAGGGVSASRNDGVAANTLVADVDGETMEFELEFQQANGSGRLVQFGKKDVRGAILATFLLLLPATLFEGDVIDSGNYNAIRYGLCGVAYYNLREMSDRARDGYMAQVNYDMGNATNYDDFFNATPERPSGFPAIP